MYHSSDVGVRYLISGKWTLHLALSFYKQPENLCNYVLGAVGQV